MPPIDTNYRSSFWPLNARQWATLLLGVFSLWVWREAQSAGCVTLLIALVAVALITLYGREYAIRYRHCLVSCHLRADSRPAQWLTRKGWITLRALILSLVSVPPVLLSLLIWPDALINVLILDMPLLLLILWRMSRWAPRWSAPEMLQILGKRWAVLMNSLLLLIALAITQLYLPLPDQIGLDLGDALRQSFSHLGSVHVACPLTLVALQVAGQFDTLTWWLMERGSAHLDSPGLRLLAWSGFLLMNSLVAWGYSRFLVQLIYLFPDESPPVRALGEKRP